MYMRTFVVTTDEMKQDERDHDSVRSCGHDIITDADDCAGDKEAHDVKVPEPLLGHREPTIINVSTCLSVRGERLESTR